MRVKILSGNEAGQIQDVSEAQGEHMCQFGFAERAPAEAPPYVYDRDAIIAAAAADREREAREAEEAERLQEQEAAGGQAEAGQADAPTPDDETGEDQRHRPGVAD